jgi:integrase
MPRQAKPRKWRKWYVTDLGGRRRKLCLINEGLPAAQNALDRLKVERQDNGGRTFPDFTVAELAVQFLQQVETEKPQPTFAHYQTKLKPFVKLFGSVMARQLHLTDGVRFKKKLIEEGYGACTINHHIRAAKRVLNWAVEEAEFLPKNPLKRVKLLPEHGRERIVTEAEFQALLRNCIDAIFKQILVMLRFTGARPGELRKLTWHMVKWELHCLIIPARKTKTGTTAKEPKPRIIPILPAAEALLRYRQRTYGRTERVFPDLHGNQWKEDTFCQRFRRLRERAGITPDENGEQLVPYSLRHTRLTEAAVSDELSGPMLQKLAGHTTFRMTQRYLHPTESDVYDAVLKGYRRRQSGK